MKRSVSRLVRQDCVAANVRILGLQLLPTYGSMHMLPSRFAAVGVLGIGVNSVGASNHWLALAIIPEDRTNKHGSLSPTLFTC